MFTMAQKLIVSGMALLLFGIMVAIMSRSVISYIIGGLGLVFVACACLTKESE